ncbi:MAG TPA: ROK family protein [Noviherbaspirillum sp.]
MQNEFFGAIDIGGTKVAAMVAGRDGPLARVTEPTAKTGSPRALPEQVLRLLNAACVQAGVDMDQVRAVGVASAGPFVQHDTGLHLVTPNICGGLAGDGRLPNDWKSIPLEPVLRERFSELAIENDCVAALVAERSLGAVVDEPDCVYVTWSTGVGFGLCVNGQILRGKHGNAGHGGHMLMSEVRDTLCGCGNRGDLESLISGANLGGRAGGGMAQLYADAEAGDEAARELVLDAARWLGRALYNITALLDTRVFVIGGSVWNHHGHWLRPLVQEEIENRLPALTAGVRILPAGLGPLVADLGAISLVLPQEYVTHWRATRPWAELQA